MRATLFVDIWSNERECLIREAAYERFEKFDFISCNVSGLIAVWHKAAVRPSKDHFVCYITQYKSLADADVVYALFCARVPVLAFRSCGAGLSRLFFSPTDLSVKKRYWSEDLSDKLLRSFFPHQCGQHNGVIVIEGGDGAGKQTQTKLQVERLRSRNFEVQTLDFPYEKASYGGLIRVVLSGKKGGISDLDPKLFSFIYSLNRYACLPELRLWIQRRQVVLCDRYYTANFGHQGAKMTEQQRISFIRHLEVLESDWLTLPHAEKVYYLDLLPQIAMEAMESDRTRQSLDIHETAGDAYKRSVRMTFLWCCQELQGWKCINCCASNGTRRTPNELHGEIYEDLCNSGVLQNFVTVT